MKNFDITTSQECDALVSLPLVVVEEREWAEAEKMILFSLKLTPRNAVWEL
jgi:hypothetical protein